MLLGDSTGEGIYRARWNAATGEIGSPELAIATPQPTYLALHPSLPVLYACNETDVPNAAVSAFKVDRQTASLKFLGSQQTKGGAPCFASVDRRGRLLFAANYTGGSLAAFSLDTNGLPAPATEIFGCSGNPACGTSGPVKARQSAPHLHCATISPDNRYVLACDLGDDAILVFPIHPGNAQPLGTPLRIPSQAGAGPRHLVFHPNGRWLYCAVNQYNWRISAAGPQVVQASHAAVSILPANAPSDSTGAEIRITRNGKYAYTSTRFCDVLTVLSIDQHSGRLTQVQQLPSGGKTPRLFALDPTENWLVCANQDSNNISVFNRDPKAGQLTPAHNSPATNPECLLWL